MKETYKRLILESQNLSSTSWPRLWDKEISSKVTGMVWRKVENRILTKENLGRREVVKQGVSRCAGECDSEQSISHSFLNAPFSQVCGIAYVIGLEWSLYSIMIVVSGA